MNLQSILQDLVTHCKTRTSKDVNLVVELPASVIGDLSRCFEAKERVKLDGTVANPAIISKLQFTDGTVELKSQLNT